MIEPERIQRLAAKLGNRNDALEFVRQMRCGGKKYDGGGKYFRTNLQDESPLMYQPMMPVYPDVAVPERYYPQPDYGDYEYPESTGMIQAMPIRVNAPASAPMTGVLADEVTVPVSDLFSDEAIARRALKQRYAESSFNDRAVSKAGAQGAWQIMPITLKDYLGRGRGKAGDLNDPEYNRKVRDWVMGIIPRDLQEFWSEDDSDRSKLAKLYAAYNWGAGNLRGFLRKKQKAGVDISNPDNWVDDLNPETRRYVKYLAFDEDIPDSIYTNSAFENAARSRGYMAGGGKIRIKPENRGKFTALKKRTGHSASWFKAHGTPAQKKMAIFALNAKKWKHGDGGFINTFEDGGDEERVPWYRLPVRVPNMTGTATAAATGLRDIPLTDSTVGRELAVAGTALAAPFAESGVAINWLSNPANQILATKFAVPMLAGSAVESGVRAYTPYKGVGDLMYNAPVIPGTNWSPAEYDRRHGAPAWQQRLTQEALGFVANPGYYTPTGLLANMTDRVAQRYAEDFAAHVAQPVREGWNYLRDWYDFVGRGDTGKFTEPLRYIDALRQREAELAKDIGRLEGNLRDYPKLKLRVWPKIRM